MFRKPSAVFGQLLKNHEDFENQNSELEVQTFNFRSAKSVYIFPLAKVHRDVPASSGSIEIIPAVAFRPVTVPGSY